MPSPPEAFFTAFNVQVTTSVKTGTQFFYITLYLEVTKEAFKNKSYIFLLKQNNKLQCSNIHMHVLEIAAGQLVHAFEIKLYPGIEIKLKKKQKQTFYIVI